MKTLKFKTKISKNKILIPLEVQSELDLSDNESISVILLLDNTEEQDEVIMREIEAKNFFKGYAATDSIYDNDES